MDLFAITSLAFVATAVGTFTGFGASTIMLPVLVLFLPFPQALLLGGIIHWFGDVWKMLLFRTGIRWKLIVTFGIPGILASGLGGWFTFAVPVSLLTRFLGAMLVAYVVFLVFKPRFHVSEKPRNAVVAGALSGFTAWAFGFGGAVRSAFLTAFNLPKAAYLFTNGALAFLIDATRITTYIAGGTRLDTTLWTGFLFFIPASLLGAVLAQRVVLRVPEQRFRAVIAVFIFLIGIRLLLFPA